MARNKRDEFRKAIVHDAAAAAVVYLVDHFDMLPADKGWIANFFGHVIEAAIESAVVLDRRERQMPSDN